MIMLHGPGCHANAALYGGVQVSRMDEEVILPMDKWQKEYATMKVRLPPSTCDQLAVLSTMLSPGRGSCSIGGTHIRADTCISEPRQLVIAKCKQYMPNLMVSIRILVMGAGAPMREILAANLQTSCSATKHCRCHTRLDLVPSASLAVCRFQYCIDVLRPKSNLVQRLGYGW